jgi:hypothetical protein
MKSKKVIQSIPSFNLDSSETHSDLPEPIQDPFPKKRKLAGSASENSELNQDNLSGSIQEDQVVFNVDEACTTKENPTKELPNQSVNNGVKPPRYHEEIENMINMACGREKNLDSALEKLNVKIDKNLEKFPRFNGYVMESYLNQMISEAGLKHHESRCITNFKQKFPGEKQVFIDFPNRNFKSQGYTDILSKLSFLIKWPILINMAVLEELNLNNIIYEIKLSNWLSDIFYDLKLRLYYKILRHTNDMEEFSQVLQLIISKLALKNSNSNKKQLRFHSQ